MKNFGFTLVEVLITIGVIGVVSALTIPNLITSYQKYVTAESLKKGYATFQNVIRQSEDDNGDYSSWDALPTINGPVSISIFDNFINKYIAPYIEIIGTNRRTGIKSIGGVNVIYINNCHPWFYLKDGTCFTVGAFSGIHAYFTIIYDINGNSGPNRYGRDIFAFRTYRNNLDGRVHGLQFGNAYIGQPQAYENDCTKENKNYDGGLSCGMIIKQNNWKIPKDYPW